MQFLLPLFVALFQVIHAAENVESFDLEYPQHDTTFANVLDNLSNIVVSENDEIATKILGKIDRQSLTEQNFIWIAEHLCASNFLKNLLEKEKWPLPAIRTYPKLRMITHFYQNMHFSINQLQDTKVTYDTLSIPIMSVDIYSIDLSAETLSWTTMLAVEQVSVSADSPKLFLIFPAGIKVTDAIMNLLVNWATGKIMSDDEKNLARLIILADRVTIIIRSA